MGLELLCSVFILWSVTRVESYNIEPDCELTQWKCGNGICLPVQWVCDGKYDCDDRSDEQVCPSVGTCQPDEFLCHIDHQCIPKRLQCDGIPHCADRSDEKNCDLEPDCNLNQWRCGNGICLPIQWVCDGDYDCGDRSDERNCPSVGTCQPDEFLCHANFQCIPKRLQCDGIPHCADRSDEKNCTDPQFRCDYTYYKNASTFLKFHYIPGTWHEARRRCSYEGSSLVSPGSLLTVSFLSSIAERNQKTEIFIGINSLASDGNYYNHPAMQRFYSELPWAKGEPNNIDGNENCLVLRTDGTVADERCDIRRSFICYKNDKQETINECGTVDNGYKLYTETNKCYKFHTDPKPWSNANEVCLAEGGSLTVINNVNESHVIKKMYAENSTRTGHTAEPDIEDMAFIGFRYDNDTESYETVERRSLTESGYDQFYPGYDSCPLPEYLCGGFHKDGYLDLGDCNQRLMFICEKDPRYDTCSSTN